MEYKKDKRTINLTLRDIHVGDWVQVWSETTERYSPPLKITQICDDGTIYLVTSDEERCTPFEENIKNVDVLPIDVDLLKGFGFTLKKYGFKSSIYKKMTHTVYYGDTIIGVVCVLCDGSISISVKRRDYDYIHELLDILYRRFGIENLEWKGVDK